MKISASVKLVLFALALIASLFCATQFGPEAGFAVSVLAVGIVIGEKPIEEFRQDLEKIDSLETLQQEKNNRFDAIKKMRDGFEERGKKWEGDEEKRWKTINAEFDAVNARMDVVRSQDEMQKRWLEVEEEQRRSGRPDINQPAPGDAGGDTTHVGEQRALAFAGWMRSQVGLRPTREQRAAMKATRLSSRQRELNFRGFNTNQLQTLIRHANNYHASQRAAQMSQLIESRAMSTTGVGQQFVPQGFIPQIEIAMLEYGTVSLAADVMRTATGEPMPWPTANDTGNKGRMLSELSGTNNLDTTTSEVLFTSFDATSDYIEVSYRLLRDSSVSPQLPQIIAAMLGERLGRIKQEKFTKGTGLGEPQGIVTAAASGPTTATANALIADDVFNLYHSIDPSYRGSGFGFMMHDGIIQALRLLKDGDGQFIWQPGLTSGRPDMLIGQRVFINQEMDATVVTDNTIMLAGMLTKFKIREVEGIRFYRLTEVERRNDKDVFLAFQSFDSRLLDAGTKPIKAMDVA